MKEHKEKVAIGNSNEDTSPAGTFIMEFECPELWENKFILFSNTNLWYFSLGRLKHLYKNKSNKNYL